MQNQLVGQRYRIKGLIGEGGMASVYAAIDEKLDRRVAIKVLHAHLGRNPDIRQRFLLEAKTVSTLDHHNIIKVYDFSGLESEQLWIVTEILTGVDLAEYVKRFQNNRLQPIVATLIVREICLALAEAHKLQIVHRDIKPENIMILDSGQVKLMDFGIAKVHRANATLTGTFMGSPSYMSPEQIRGVDVDVRADIYSLSVLYYEIMTGALPYSGQSTAEVINKIIIGRYTPPNLLVTDLPYALNEVVIQGLQSHKEQRYRDIHEMILAFDRFLSVYGFGESRIELEQFFLHRSTFEDRLSKIKFPKTTHTRHEARHKVLEQGALDKKPHPANRHNNADEKHVEHSGSKMRPPRKAIVHQDGDHDPKLSRIHAPSRHIHNQGTSYPSTPNQKFEDAPAKQRHLTQHEAAADYPQLLPQLSQAGSDQLPSLAPTSTRSHKGQAIAQRSRRRSKPRATSTHYKINLILSRSKNSQPIVITLVAAIIVMLLIGTNRFYEKRSPSSKKDNFRTSQQNEFVGKKKRLKSDEAEPNSSVSTSNQNAELAPSSPEGQTAVSEVAVRTQPKPKEFTTPRSNKRIPSSTRSLVATNGVNARPNAETMSPSNPASRFSNGRDDRSPSPSDGAEANKVSLPSDRSAPANNSDRLPTEKPLPNRREPGFLKVASLPAAEILVDGKVLGTSNEGSALKLDPGSYQMRFRRKGYKTEEQTVIIRPGERKNLSVSLTKSIELVEFNIHTNRLPTNVIIEDLRDGGRRREIVLSKTTTTLNLRPGKYRVSVNHEKDQINRVMELSEEEKSITFNAEFK